MRIISDIHGNFTKYENLIHSCESSIQLGDLGFDYENIKFPVTKKNVHRFFLGNHDNYWNTNPHDIGEYGYTDALEYPFFWIRGGFSIDYRWRKQHEITTGEKTWWKEEELSTNQFDDAVEIIANDKPKLVLSHSAPDCVAKKIGNPDILRTFGFDPETFQTRTQTGLQRCFEMWQPKLWVFGHFHKFSQTVINGTTFICLPEFNYLDVTSNGVVFLRNLPIMEL